MTSPSCRPVTLGHLSGFGWFTKQEAPLNFAGHPQAASRSSRYIVRLVFPENWFSVRSKGAQARTLSLITIGNKTSPSHRQQGGPASKTGKATILCNPCRCGTHGIQTLCNPVGGVLPHQELVPGTLFADMRGSDRRALPLPGFQHSIDPKSHLIGQNV